MKIIDNIRYRFIELEEEPIPEEILKKYPKPQNMSKENEAIFDYAIRNLYNVDNVDKLKKLLITKENCKNHAYLDQGKIWTIGCGHTKGVKPGDYISDATIEKYFSEDIKEHIKYVLFYAKVPLTQNQFDMLVSWRYNTVPSQYRNSTLLKLLNNGDYIGASNEFEKWVYADNGKSEGLIKRRKEEKDVFVKDFPIFNE